MESLESRLVLTAGTVTVIDGELNICGTDEGETIIVAELQNDFFVAASFLSEPMLIPRAGITSVLVEAGDGDDTVVATSTSSDDIIIRGQGGDDRLFGGSGGDRLEGGAGDDLIYGNGGNDNLLGDDGVDLIFAGTGNDALSGGAGVDTLIGMDGNDTLFGDEGNDFLSGSAGNDVLSGLDGDDQLQGGAGNDRVFGGEGNDTLIGNGDDDELFGENGDDLLLGSGGNDGLFGGAGIDRLVGSNGDDLLSGGAGTDTLVGDAGTDELIGGDGADELFGGLGPDLLFGNGGIDLLTGGNGDDILVGHAGDDRLLGGEGKDILIGGADNDTLNGQGNEDFVVAGVANVQNDSDALREAQEYWLSDDSFELRTADLLGYTGVAGFVASGAGSAETVIGGNGRDIFYADPASVATRADNEQNIGEDQIAVSDLFFVNIGETITTTLADGVFANDMLQNGDSTPASSSIVEFPSHGSLNGGSANGGEGDFVYTLDGHGRDSFVYSVFDEDSNEWSARVRFTVPDLPELPEGAFLTDLGSGLQVYDFEVGTGTSTPSPASDVNVAYVGYLPNGQIFDQNNSANFNLSVLIDGFSEGVEGMLPGGSRRIVIPPALGYGSNGNVGAGIGGTDTIIFDVTLISFT